jgi:hypothetical protein
MGRNSADATNACLIRAARAALADVLLLLREALLLLLAAVGLVLFLGVVAAEPSGCAAAPAEVWPVTGETAIKIARAPASTRIEPRVEFGEVTTLMFSL